MPVSFTVNSKAAKSDAPPHTPLLWVIREELKLTGTKFGCGTGLCGACMVHIDGRRAFACQTLASDVRFAARSATAMVAQASARSNAVCLSPCSWLSRQACSAYPTASSPRLAAA